MGNSVKVVLRKKKNHDGTYPLAIRITIDRKSTYTYLGYNVKESDWDGVSQKIKKSHPNSVRLNNLLLKKKSEYNDSLIYNQTKNQAITASSIKTILKPTKENSFFVYADSFLDNLKKEGKYNQYIVAEVHTRYFENYLGNRNILIEQITVSLLKQFRAYLKETRKCSETTIYNYLSTLKKIYDYFLAHGNLQKSNINNYPFGKKGVPMKMGQSIKIGLNKDEVKIIEELDLSKKPKLHHARNIWLFSFYFAGMRISDVLRTKWTDIHDNRLYYAMGKNLKAGSIKIPEKALKIINEYKEDNPKHDLIFPELKSMDDINNKYSVQKYTHTCINRINRALRRIALRANINKPLSNHIARHTFGNISGDKIPIQMLQKLYRHRSIETTVGYQANFIHREEDDALDAVIGG